jgi:hypothetical protein
MNYFQFSKSYKEPFKSSDASVLPFSSLGYQFFAVVSLYVCFLFSFSLLLYLWKIDTFSKLSSLLIPWRMSSSFFKIRIKQAWIKVLNASPWDSMMYLEKISLVSLSSQNS